MPTRPPDSLLSVAQSGLKADTVYQLCISNNLNKPHLLALLLLVTFMNGKFPLPAATQRTSNNLMVEEYGPALKKAK